MASLTYTSWNQPSYTTDYAMTYSSSTSDYSTKWIAYDTFGGKKGYVKGITKQDYYNGTYSIEDLRRALEWERSNKTEIQCGQSYRMPDGAVLVVDKDGNYKIEDKDAKVTYKANRFRDFSPHLNASDMVAGFLESVAKLGLRQQEALNLPLHLFISWLIIEAAERDGDDCAGVPRIEQSQEVRLLQKPRCLTCGRFINRLRAVNHFPYCSPTHAEQHIHRIAA